MGKTCQILTGKTETVSLIFNLPIIANTGYKPSTKTAKFALSPLANDSDGDKLTFFPYPQNLTPQAIYGHV